MQFKTTPTILDIEASGFGHDSFPIEIGLVRSDGARYCSLIRPMDHWLYWSDEAEALHGLSRELLHTKGKSAHDVCSELNRFLNGETCYSDAWVKDKAWLNTLFQAANRRMEFTLSPLESIMSEAQYNMWDRQKQNTRRQLELARHRASTDAYIIQRTFLESKLITENRIYSHHHQRTS